MIWMPAKGSLVYGVDFSYGLIYERDDAFGEPQMFSSFFPQRNGADYGKFVNFAVEKLVNGGYAVLF